MLLTTREAAEYLGLSIHTLNQWRYKGVGIPYVKMGRAVRYEREVLEKFLEQSRK